MADPRLLHVALDETSIAWRSADIAQERRIAIFDLVERNHFACLRRHEDGYAGPYRLRVAVIEGRLALHVARDDDSALETHILSLAAFRRSIRDYFAITESYHQAIRTAAAHQIETVDMARRALHNQAAERLRERLAGKIEVDFDTARRLFTLICVLHIRG